MKRIFSIITIISLCLGAYAQDEGKAVPHGDMDASNVVDSSKTLDTQKEPNSTIDVEDIKSYKEQVAKLEITIKGLRDSLAFSEARVLDLDKQIKEKSDSVVFLEKEMITIASNFLYIPYEEYSINRIALRAFNNVKSPVLTQKYKNRYVLLSKYVEHVGELREFLVSVNETFSELPIMRPSAKDIAKDLRELTVYKDYSDYDNWKKTYLGKFLDKVEQEIMKLGDSQEEGAFDYLIKELDDLKISK